MITITSLALKTDFTEESGSKTVESPISKHLNCLNRQLKVNQLIDDQTHLFSPTLDREE